MVTTKVKEALDKQNISLEDYARFKVYTYRKRCWISCGIFAIINTFMFYSRMQSGLSASLSDFIITPVKMSAYMWILTLIIINTETPEHMAIKRLEKMYTKRFRKFNILLERINNLKLRKPGVFNGK